MTNQVLHASHLAHHLLVLSSLIYFYCKNIPLKPIIDFKIFSISRPVRQTTVSFLWKATFRTIGFKILMSSGVRRKTAVAEKQEKRDQCHSRKARLTILLQNTALQRNHAVHRKRELSPTRVTYSTEVGRVLFLIRALWNGTENFPIFTNTLVIITWHPTICKNMYFMFHGIAEIFVSPSIRYSL